jgi:hypothetical protein
MACRGGALPHVRRQVLIGRWRGASAGVDRRAQLAAVTIHAIVTAWRGLTACSWTLCGVGGGAALVGCAAPPGRQA